MELINIELQENTDMQSGFKQEKKLLESNQMLAGKQQSLELNSIKEAATFYRERFTEINRALSQLTKDAQKAQNKKRQLQAQLKELNAGKRPTSEVYLTLNVKSAGIVDLRLRYVVNDAGWSPIYDLMVNDLNQPINLKYRALAFNDTGIDWKNVKITLSTSDPMQSAAMPILLPWQLKEFSPQVFAYDQGRLNTLRNQLPQKQKESQIYVDGIRPDDLKQGNIRFEEIEISELSTDFDITEPYTIPADRKPYSIEVQDNNLKATYTHYSVPKMDKDAFLLAQVLGWEELNLIPGPVNIYYDQSFVGFSDLDPRNFNDTLNLSLGRDKMVLVKREKLNELTKKQFMAGKKKMTVAYKITVKNNRSQPIDFDLLDQVPISTRKEIEVDVKEISGARHFENTGKLEWKFKVNPGESKSFNLTYSITYPKDMEIRLDKTRKMVTPRYY